MNVFEKIEERQAIKENAIRLVKHHKKHCDGESCNISLYLLKRALDLAEIKLNDDEKRIFW